MGAKKNRKKKVAAAAAAPEPPLPVFADKAAEAEYYKGRGNAHFGQGAIQAAIECYTKALDCDPNSAVVLSNRSASFMKAQKYEDALADAEKCVEANPSWAKGYFRKGNALAKLRRVNEAERVFKEGLICDEDSDELQNQVRRMAELRKKEYVAQGLVEGQTNDGLYSGSFRWGKSKELHAMPNYPFGTPTNVKSGWMKYLSSRTADAKERERIVSLAQTDPSFLDGLSFPMTAVWLIDRLELIKKGVTTEFNIVVLGATVKAEEHILRYSDYWHEIALHFPNVNLHIWMSGPELSDTNNASMRAELDAELSINR
jgi:tetratricopeptide (TPR) repeat protein